jgi:Fur family ferric uptake transcriptional regulator
LNAARHRTPRNPDDILARYLAERGLKSTRQRTLIVTTFFEAKGHVNVDELLTRVRAQDPRVSAATVYRTMKLLTECGLAHARHFEEGQTRYERAAGRHHHDHLICTRCGAIVEFENEEIERLQEAVARKLGFRVTHHKMELYGQCSRCQREADA